MNLITDLFQFSENIDAAISVYIYNIYIYFFNGFKMPIYFAGLLVQSNDWVALYLRIYCIF